MSDHRRTRRTVLSAVGVVTGIGPAGCLRLADEDVDGEDGTSDSDEDEDGTGGEDEGDDEPLESVSLKKRWEVNDIEGTEAFAERYGLGDRIQLQTLTAGDDYTYMATPHSGAIAVVDPTGPTIDSSFGDHSAGWDGLGSSAGWHGLDRSHDGTVYLAGREDDVGKIVAVNGEDDLIWKSALAGDREWIRAFATGQEYLFVGLTDTGHEHPRAFQVFDTDGNEVFVESWSDDTRVSNFRDFAIHDGVAYLGEPNTAFAYDTEQRELFEPTERYGFEHNRYMTIADGVMYTTSPRESEETKAIDLDNRVVQYEVPVEGMSSPLVHGETLLVGGPTGLYSLDRETGEERWHVRTTNEVDERPLVVGGILFAFDDSDILYAVSADDGSILYDDEPPDDGRASLHAAGGYFLMDSPSGTIGVEPSFD